MKPIRIAVNGLGRIGRAFVRKAISDPRVMLIAVNELASINNSVYLLSYDTVYGRSTFSVSSATGSLQLGGTSVKYLSEKDPAKLPWKDLDIDIVIESTGFFASPEKAELHRTAGAKKVVVSAPFEGGEKSVAGSATVLLGTSEEMFSSVSITSNASCTTNAASPVITILEETIGIERAILNTVHAYTATQRIVDGPDAKDWRRGRAGAQNIVPSTTGAARAVTLALPALQSRFDGISLRVPVASGSLADITLVPKRPTTEKEVNDIFIKASQDPRWSGVLTVTHDPIVSSDVIGQPYGSIIDLAFTKVVDGLLIKVLAWYDNEAGYAGTLLEHAVRFAKVR